MRTLFIVGCPRSGTTLLQQILGRHPEVLVPPETHFFTKLLSRWPGRFARQLERLEADLEIDLAGARRPRDARAAGALFERLAVAYAAARGRPGARWLAEKTPDHLHHLDAIDEALPAARLISIVRDGRDVALSLSRVPWAPNDLQACFGIWLEAARRQAALDRRPPAGWLSLRFEDLVSEPEAVVRRVVAHLELDWDERLLTPGDPPRGVAERERGWKADAHAAIDPARVGGWRRALDSRQVERLESWGGDVLEAHGYALASVAPGTGRGGPGLAARWARWRWRAGAFGRLLLGRD